MIRDYKASIISRLAVMNQKSEPITEGDSGHALINAHEDRDSALSQQDSCSIHNCAFEVNPDFMDNSSGWGFNATSLW